MQKSSERIEYKFFRMDAEYFTFISGALVTIPLVMLFEIAGNYNEIAFWVGLFFAILASFYCFKLSLVLKKVHVIYESNRIAVGDTVSAWNGAIREKRASSLKCFILSLIFFAVAIICIMLMQFNNPTDTNEVGKLASRIVYLKN